MRRIVAASVCGIVRLPSLHCTESVMPHLTVEYSGNLFQFPVEATLRALNQLLLDSGHFEESDIKSRALRFDQFAVGTASDPRAFIHARLALLSGRPVETKRELSQALLRGLEQLCPCPIGFELQVSVEVQDLERESYAKAVLKS